LSQRRIALAIGVGKGIAAWVRWLCESPRRARIWPLGQRVNVINGSTANEEPFQLDPSVFNQAVDGKKLSLVLDTVGGTPVGELAKGLKTGGSVVVYALQSGHFPALSPKDLIYRGLSLHGFWLINWIRNAPRTEVQEIYQKLGDLVADGLLSAAVEHVYPLEQFKEAFEHSLRSSRNGKILFKFGANESQHGKSF